MIHFPKSLIDFMKKASIKCVSKHPELHDHPYLCENIHLSPHQDRNSFTLHTHTIAGVDYPSKNDLETTKRLKKKNLCIINTADHTLTCFKGKNFQVKEQKAI